MSLQSAHKLITATIPLSDVAHLDPEIQSAMEARDNGNRLVELLKDRYGNNDRLEVKIADKKAEFRWVLPKVSAAAEALHRQALESARRKDFNTAVAKWSQAVADNPDDPDYYFNLGLAFFESKNYREAIENLRRALAICPIYHRAYLILGTILLKIRKFDEAEKYLRESLYFNPRNALGYLNLGAVHSIQKKYRDGIASFQRAIELSPREMRAYFGLAKIHSILGDSENANLNYRKVIELDQRGALATHARRAMASASQVASQQTTQDTVELENLETLYSEGYKAYLFSDYHQAAAMYQKYLEHKANDDQVWSALGIVCQRAGALDRAVAAFQQATRLNPSKALYFKQLGIAFDCLDQPKEAVEAMVAAAELGKDDSVLLAIWGRNLLKLNLITEAITHLERATRLNKSNLLAHLYLASALTKMGESERATSHLEVVMSAKIKTPLKEEAQMLLKKLRT